MTVARGTQYYVMLADGLAQISQTQETLLDVRARRGTGITLTPSQVTGHMSTSTVARRRPAWPRIPSVVTPARPPRLHGLRGRRPALAGGSRRGARLPSGGMATGYPPMSGSRAPARRRERWWERSGPGSGMISYFLIAGGRRYALARRSVVGMLGYNRSQAVLLPAGVVDLIPAGPALDPALATKAVPAGG